MLDFLGNLAALCQGYNSLTLVPCYIGETQDNMHYLTAHYINQSTGEQMYQVGFFCLLARNHVISFWKRVGYDPLNLKGKEI